MPTWPPQAVRNRKPSWPTPAIGSHNATLEIAAEVLIVPIPATVGVTDPEDPRLAQRTEVIGRLDRGEVSVRQAATEMGVSTPWARKLLADHRNGGVDPALIRAQMLERLETEEGAAAYAKRKVTVEPVFGNLKANLGFRRFSAAEWTRPPANGG